jgi:hypothetical protein
VLATFKGSCLEGCHYQHPLYERVSPLVLGGDYITTDSGTGLVHTAPGHGQEDYQVGGGQQGRAAAAGWPALHCSHTALQYSCTPLYDSCTALHCS